MAIRDHRCFCQHRSCRSPHMRKCSSLVNSPSYKPVIPKGYNSMAIRYRENDDRIEWATRFFRHTQFYTHTHTYIYIYTKTFKRVSIQRPLEGVTIQRPLIFSVCMKLESRTLGFIMVYHYLLGRVPTNEPLEV